MESTGIVRKIDELGRIVLPKELRRTFHINEKDPLEIYVDEGGRIILKKYEPTCVFCGSINGLTSFNGHNVCCECIENMAESCDSDTNE
jgi:transcriptional pleiotropic regulator of transition state genes